MVEWKKMWEVTTWDKKFSGVEKYMQPKVIKYYYYLANELADLERLSGDIRILYTTNKEAYTNSIDVEGTISEGEVVTIPWGGNVNIQYYNGKFVTADNRIATSNNTDYLNNKFLYYWMLSQKDEIAKMYRGAGIQHPSMLSVLSMSIPIPSLEEQTRIVGILDTFTSAIDNLKEQIAQRRKQYEYYRDQLLDLEGKPGVEMKTLGEVCKIGDGLHGTPIYNETGDFFFINGNNLGNGKILIKSDTKKVDDTMFSKYGIELDNKTILMSINGTIGNIAVYNGEKIILGKSAAYFKIFKDDVILYRFLYYSLQTTNSNNYYMESLTGTTIKNLGLKALRNYYIPLPPLSEQQRIVSILETFEASIQNLEAQLKEREKQYEYYRNKLLTFE